MYIAYFFVYFSCTLYAVKLPLLEIESLFVPSCFIISVFLRGMTVSDLRCFKFYLTYLNFFAEGGLTLITLSEEITLELVRRFDTSFPIYRKFRVYVFWFSVGEFACDQPSKLS